MSAVTDEDIETALDCGFPPKAAAAQLGVSRKRVEAVQQRLVDEMYAAFPHLKK